MELQVDDGGVLDQYVGAAVLDHDGNARHVGKRTGVDGVRPGIDVDRAVVGDIAVEPGVVDDRIGASPFAVEFPEIDRFDGLAADGQHRAVRLEHRHRQQLDGERGRADTVFNDTRLNGDVANNNAVNVNTGSNTIDAGSFANMSGIPVVIQNSGANVLIQNATVINLQFQ